MSRSDRLYIATWAFIITGTIYNVVRDDTLWWAIYMVSALVTMVTAYILERKS